MYEKLEPQSGMLSETQEPLIHHNWRPILRYLAKKIFFVVTTIFIGIFLVVIVINRPVRTGLGTAQPQLDTAVRQGIERSIRKFTAEHYGNYTDQQVTDLRVEMEEESGINHSPFIKNLIFTFRAMKFDWGRLSVGTVNSSYFLAHKQQYFNLNEIILQYLPITMILVVTAYILIILIGLPVALKLSQNQNSLVDKIVSFLAPISSVPSWVIGLLLIYIFVIELRLLPIGGMLDTLPPENKIGYIPIILKHMILPVTAIVISLIFQIIYSWRTMFITFGQEDYVDLALCMGLPNRKLQKKYILKPTLPYVLTSFSLMLISFWQMTMALEVVFQWRGIGWLYINIGLPNFWGESMYPGNLIIALSLVVLFAYILGIVVIVLDVIYVIVDPRIRLQDNQGTLKSLFQRRNRKVKKVVENRTLFPVTQSNVKTAIKDQPITDRISLPQVAPYQQFKKRLKLFILDIRKFPAAIIGLIMILFLLLGSIYAVVALPYEKIGVEWQKSNLTGKVYRPRVAQPAWTNLFRSKDFLSTMLMSSHDNGTVRSEVINSDGSKQITETFSFNYQYADIPGEIYLYLDGTYAEKSPFVSLTWITPDGREIDLRGMAVTSGSQYDFEKNIPAQRWVDGNSNWQKWVNLTQIFPTPYHFLLFVSPDNSAGPEVVNGTYQLVIHGYTFERDSDIHAELVLLGNVYGPAGTDYYRRDLIIPLLWGMPFALIIGLLGSLVTTLISMILAAAGVWFGGWVDDVIQRLTEMNLVLPVLAIGVLAYAYLNVNIWVVLFLIVMLNVFGSPTKNFRAAFLQVKNLPYIEAAQAYGAGNLRIITHYMVPKIIPILVPQLVILIPSFVFLEATLGLFNITTGLPTWGTVIYEAMTKGALFGSRYWVLEPLALLLLTGLAFALFGSALERILNPKLLEE